MVVSRSARYVAIHFVLVVREQERDIVVKILLLPVPLTLFSTTLAMRVFKRSIFHTMKGKASCVCQPQPGLV